MPKQFVPAEWDSQAQLWMANSEQRVPFSGTWPTSGMTRNGRLLPPEASEPPTSGSVSSSSPLLPSPRATDGTKGGPNQRGSKGDLMLPSAVMSLLPTPVVTDSAGARNATANRRDPESKHHSGTTLTDAVTLLPTPSVADGTGGHATRSGARGGELLLPGVARAYGNGDLLPTPNASDGSGGGQHPDKREGHSRQLIDYVLAPERWGKYGPAIERWEGLTRPAPAPTEPNTRGNPRLSPAFSEWMMGWAEGWVTDFINNTGKRATPEGYISRTDALRQVGNGVCTRQAVAALRDLLSRGAA